MKQIELKDLETGKEYIVAFHKDKQWIPCVVKVIKEKNIKFICPKDQISSPLEINKEYSINNFWYEHRGIDIFGNKFKMLNTFETIEICQLWCDFEKEICDFVK